MAAPSNKPPGKPGTPAKPDGNEPGRIAKDDLGNMTWQWSNNDVLQADDTSGAIERLKALVDPNLDVLEEDAPNSLKQNSKGLKVGYNPYDSGSLGKTARKKKKDLRKLSQWIETKRKVGNKPEPSDE